ncbi:MAG: hypothetical protein OQK98_05795 [Gammaproteobacteria bacterium]|nr:hypothetical protein [Gammaproteobacteria bacterium]
MKSLVKKTIWLIIYLLPILALIYYRAFIFTPHFNKPIDNALNDLSQAIGFEIPSYKLANNEGSLYKQYLGDSETTVQTEVSVNTTTPLEEPVSQPADMMNGALEPEVELIPEVESAAIETEESDLDMKQIVSAVKESVSESLETFMDEKESQPLESESSLLSAQELLFKARLAYWNGDLKTAENTYIQLTEMLSDDPNVYGELGNLYYMQSKWKLASDAYYHAALKLSKTKNAYQAQHLLRIIRGLDTETADKLQAELNHTS